MTQKEFRARKEKSKKCLYCIDFFGIGLCFFHANENTVQNKPFKIHAPLCTDLEKCAYDLWEENSREKIRGEKIMAKDFGKAASSKKFGEVGRASAEKAQVITVKMIPNEKLHDYPNNREDVRDTIDLENSIKELGFIDPIEVTDFGQPDGEYMIVSGHRRRKSGVNVGMNMFPSIVRHFKSEEEVENYVLLANSQRDSAKDPLLFCRRYKMHEEYLKSIDFKGNIRDEIAKRLGISKSHADRYNTMNKVIFPVWDMIRDEIVGMSSVLPMASHDEAEQLEIYNIMQDALESGTTLTRDVVKKTVDGYRAGKKSWDEISGNLEDNASVMNPLTSDESLVALKDNSEESSDSNTYTEDEPLLGQRTFEDFQNEKNTSDDKSNESKRAKEIVRLVKKLNTAFDNEYSFSNEDEAAEALVNMGNTFTAIIEQMYDIAKTHKLETVYNSAISKMKLKIEDFQ